jgi:lipopolysaccharide transport system permease protein
MFLTSLGENHFFNNRLEWMGLQGMKLFRETVIFIRHIIDKKYALYELARRDFSAQYIQNMFGLSWAVLDPLCFLLILWFIFGVGFRSGRQMEVPFITYLVTGLVAFNYFAASLPQATNAISQYSFLVKKIKFRLSLLPVIKILSALVIHLIVLVITLFILVMNGIRPSWFWLQVFYYLAAATLLIMGISWATAATRVFFPDISNILAIIIRFMLYLTPIFWDIKRFPPEYKLILKLNPLYYIVNGYRNSLLFHKYFWESPLQTMYFWGVTAGFLFLGITVFRRLKPHFADVIS